MKLYRILKIYHSIKSPRVKLLGILLMHLLRRRYIGVFFDSALSCNIRCRMCYFSDPESRKYLHGRFSDDDIKALAKSIFPRALKLQIGCGAEPTVDARLPKIIKLAKAKGVPYVAVTTNGNLLDSEKIEELYDAGLDELTISAHGLTRETYEKMMSLASFDKFIRLREGLRQLREKHPDFKIRFNYTVNEDNVNDLAFLPEFFKGVLPNVIQIRPIQKIGESSYSNFSLEKIINNYDESIQKVVDFCNDNGIVCLYPTIDNLKMLGTFDVDNPITNVIDDLLYFYISPYDKWKEKINPYEETFDDYCRKTHRVRFILKNLFRPKETECKDDERTEKLNYNIK